jgi:heterotetrameric sarcosine oxidase delta subunit
MLIPHPLLGPRDAQEFVYLGPAALIDRPEIGFPLADPEAALDTFHAYLHERENPAGLHRELWFHEQGDRSWLVVTRDTRTHEIVGAELAVDVARAAGRGRGPEAPPPAKKETAS